jgi:anti-sigma B factor antagonist
MALGISIEKGEFGVYRVILTGSLDTETAEQLDLRMLQVLNDATVRSVRMELHELSFISSVGMGSLAKIKKAVTAKGGVMVVVGAQPQIARVFEIVKMLPKQSMFSSVKEADEYFAAIQKKFIEENRQANRGGH